ncbi:MAG: hypothetical protein FWD68_02500 [Alphaproteobacteria bacterium]|nr:hypothetical protein [Alphaproteobacteria bacterium]
MSEAALESGSERDDAVKREKTALFARFAGLACQSGFLVGMAGFAVVGIVPGVATPMGGVRRIRGDPVAAVAEIGITEYDAGPVRVPAAEAQGYFDPPDGGVRAIAVFVGGPDDVGAMHAPITAAAAGPLTVADWRRCSAAGPDELQIGRREMFRIRSRSAAVAALIVLQAIVVVALRSGTNVEQSGLSPGRAGFLRGKR